MEDVSKKTIAFSVQAANFTADLLKSVLRDFLSGNTKSKGKVSYSQLAKHGKLDSIEITENNIKDFINIARKYDVDYALKRNNLTEPPTYQVFFTASNSENFTRAFKEYAYGADKKLEKEKSAIKVVSREQIKENAKAISKEQSKKEKAKNKSKSDISGR